MSQVPPFGPSLGSPGFNFLDGGFGAFAKISYRARAKQVGTPPSLGDTSHPECYDAAKMNDPNDFCYQTIGPWNSRLLTDDEVRSVVTLDQMISAGHPTDQIRRFYPEYQPTTK